MPDPSVVIAAAPLPGAAWAAPPWPRALAFGVAAALGLAVAYGVWRIPVQVPDALGEILDAQRSPSIADSFVGSAVNAAYLRPLRIAQIKLLFDLSRGEYSLFYRGFHVLLVVALVWLFTRALRVQSPVDAAAAAFALTVLTGLHTFLALVREAFPINHFLEIAVLCVAALNLAQSRGGWWVDVSASLVFATAALTLESGLLVWVVVAAAWLAGFRGVSARGVAGVTVLLLAYLVVRFGVLQTGVPSLAERSANVLFERLEPEELQRRFGENPLPFYAYNVVASGTSVLFAEPREGRLTALRAWRDRDVPPRIYVAVGSSAALTLLAAWWAAACWRGWRRGRALATPERIAIVAAAVVAANAALSYAYTKDDIVSVAGVFYALAAYGAARSAAHAAAAMPPARRLAASVLLLALASAWAVRSFSVQHVLRRQAFRTRNDWAHVARDLKRENRWPADPQAQRIIERLTADALDAPVPNAQLLPEWNNRWFGD